MNSKGDIRQFLTPEEARRAGFDTPLTPEEARELGELPEQIRHYTLGEIRGKPQHSDSPPSPPTIDQIRASRFKRRERASR